LVANLLLIDVVVDHWMLLAGWLVGGAISANYPSRYY
jgi:hypothetical protein